MWAAGHPFFLRVGTPPQGFRIFQLTNTQQTLVLFPEGCLASDPSNCDSLRGVVPFKCIPSNGFQNNESSAWVPNGLFTLDIEDSLNLTVGATEIDQNQPDLATISSPGSSPGGALSRVREAHPSDSAFLAGSSNVIPLVLQARLRENVAIARQYQPRTSSPSTEDTNTCRSSP